MSFVFEKKATRVWCWGRVKRRGCAVLRLWLPSVWTSYAGISGAPATFWSSEGWMDGWRGKSRKESKHVVLSKVDVGKSLDIDLREWVEPTKTAMLQTSKHRNMRQSCCMDTQRHRVIRCRVQQEGPGIESEEVGWIVLQKCTAITQLWRCLRHFFASSPWYKEGHSGSPCQWVRTNRTQILTFPPAQDIEGAVEHSSASLIWKMVVAQSDLRRAKSRGSSQSVMFCRRPEHPAYRLTRIQSQENPPQHNHLRRRTHPTQVSRWEPAHLGPAGTCANSLAKATQLAQRRLRNLKIYMNKAPGTRLVITEQRALYFHPHFFFPSKVLGGRRTFFL